MKNKNTDITASLLAFHKKKKMTPSEAGKLGAKRLIEKHGLEHLRNLGLKYGYKKGHKSGMTGRHHTPESANKISVSLTGKKYPEKSGPNHPAWVGGLTKEGYPREFNKKLKREILERDKFVCQLCRLTQEESKKYYKASLHVHHIDFVKTNLSENNLCALCTFCNSTVNWNREFYTKYLKARLERKENTVHMDWSTSVSFFHFHKRNSHLRFFQAILAFTGYKILLVADGDGELKDPFYWEGKRPS